MFKNLTIGKKIGLGFGVVMTMLAVVSVLSYTGVGGIVDNASAVIGGNKLDGNLAQKEVDHLNWANQVSALLTDESVTELTVQTDDHKCAFGEWLYGEERKEAEKQIPSIAPLLKEIEGYHADLHKSAIAIGQHFKQADATVPGTLAAREVDHLVWADKVNQLFLENLAQLEVETDPHKCGLGKWLGSDEVKTLVAADAEFGQLLDAVKEPHAKLHASAVDIQKAWEQQHEGLVNTLQARLDDHRKWAAAVAGALLNNEKVEVEIDPTKCAFGTWLDGDECKQLCAEWPEFAAIIDKVTGHHDKLHASADHIGKEWKKVHPGLTHTLQARLDDHRKWAAAIAGALLANQKIEVETDPHKCAFGKWLDGDECKQACAQWPEFAAIIEKVKGHHGSLHASAIKIGEAADQNAKADIYEQETMVELEEVGKLFAQAIALEEQNVEGSAKASEIYQTVTCPELEQVGTLFGDAIKAEVAIVEAGQHAREILDKQTLPALGHTREAIHKCGEHATHALDGMAQANQVFAAQTKPNLEKTQELLNKIRQEVKANVMTDEAMLGAAQGTKRNVTVVGIVAIIIGSLLAFFIARGIVKALTRIIAGLNEGADQVNDAAAQVSSASQQLAEGASEQASSLEETSSALEEMSAMTRTNAENAKEANNLSGQARDAAQSGDQTMEKLNSAMTAINESSGQISKIIRVIEEIAFQTNLLALNAAVEAARAGEHGKGFAVVADEVRNLAQRCAQAARETTGLIEGSVNNAKEGTDVAGEVGNALSAIVGDVTKVTDLVDGITKASEEQAQGVDQVNTAVSQMDKVTQQNAAGAEESASAAEELSAQAATVKSMVDELSAMVGGNSQQATKSASPTKAKNRLHVNAAHLKSEESHAPAKKPKPVTTKAASGAGGNPSQEFMDLGDKDDLSGF